MFFGAVENFQRTLLRRTLPHALILRLPRAIYRHHRIKRWKVVNELGRKKITVILCEANPRVLAKLQAAELLASPPGPNYQESVRDALRQAMRR